MPLLDSKLLLPPRATCDAVSIHCSHHLRPLPHRSYHLRCCLNSLQLPPALLSHLSHCHLRSCLNSLPLDRHSPQLSIVAPLQRHFSPFLLLLHLQLCLHFLCYCHHLQRHHNPPLLLPPLAAPLYPSFCATATLHAGVFCAAATLRAIVPPPLVRARCSDQHPLPRAPAAPPHRCPLLLHLQLTAAPPLLHLQLTAAPPLLLLQPHLQLTAAPPLLHLQLHLQLYLHFLCCCHHLQRHHKPPLLLPPLAAPLYPSFCASATLYAGVCSLRCCHPAR